MGFFGNYRCIRSFLKNTLSQLKKMFILAVSAYWQVMLPDMPISCSSHHSAMIPEKDSFATYIKVHSSSKDRRKKTGFSHGLLLSCLLSCLLTTKWRHRKHQPYTQMIALWKAAHHSTYKTVRRDQGLFSVRDNCPAETASNATEILCTVDFLLFRFPAMFSGKCDLQTISHISDKVFHNINFVQ